MPQTLDSTTGPTSSQQNGVSRAIMREDKEDLAQTSTSALPGDEGIHYGRKFSETVERFQARHAEREAHKDDDTSTEGAAAARVETEADANEQPGRKMEARQEAPSSAPAVTPSLLEEVLTNSWSRVTAFTKATGAFLHSGWNLAMLPRDTVTIAARRLLRSRTA